MGHLLLQSFSTTSLCVFECGCAWWRWIDLPVIASGGSNQVRRLYLVLVCVGCVCVCAQKRCQCLCLHGVCLVGVQTILQICATVCVCVCVCVCGMCVCKRGYHVQPSLACVQRARFCVRACLGACLCTRVRAREPVCGCASRISRTGGMRTQGT